MLHFIFQDPPVKSTAGKICLFRSQSYLQLDARCTVRVDWVDDISYVITFFLSFSFKAGVTKTSNAVTSNEQRSNEKASTGKNFPRVKKWKNE